jgi:hypothetical protein
MAISLGRRKRSRGGPDPARSEIARAERAAVTTLADTLRQLAAELPEDSLLRAEFASVARSIDVAGVVGAWRLDALARESGDGTEEQASDG